MVMHPLWVLNVPGSISGSGDLFMFDFLFCCCVLGGFWPKILFVKQFGNSLCNVSLLSILNIFQDF